MTIRCFVADDHPAVVSAVSRYLSEHGLDVVGSATSGAEAVAKIERMAPEVALLDLRMPGLGGIEAVQQLSRGAGGTRTLIYTGHADQALLDTALDAGASGVVLKEAPLADLVRAVETVAAGGVYVDPIVAGVAVTRSADTPELTARERDVLRLLADGFTNEEIGKKLFISAETVRAHVAKASRKLGARTRTQAVATALRLSLIS